MIDWLNYWEFWITLGIVLLILESLEGSFNYFLPTSLGGFLCGIFVFLLPDATWKVILFVFATGSLLAFYALKKLIKKKDETDINDY